MKPDPHYISVISPALIILRLPTVDEPRWRHVLRALTPIMRERGLRQKDISSLEGIIPRHEPEDAVEKEIRRKLDSAFQSSSHSYYPAFALYDWVPTTKTFRLIRAGDPHAKPGEKERRAPPTEKPNLELAEAEAAAFAVSKYFGRVWEVAYQTARKQHSVSKSIKIANNVAVMVRRGKK